MITNNDSLTFDRVDEFTKEYNKLKKKYRTLEEDFTTFEEILSGFWPKLPPGNVRISNLGNELKIPIYKARHFYCKCLNKGSRSGFRVIYAFLEDEYVIIFLEIYHKNKKANENQKRIYDYFG